MKLNRKNLSFFLLFLFLGLVLGSLAWEIFERLVRLLGVDLSLTMHEPLRLFDLYVIALSIRVNPGSLVGAAGGAVLFGRV